MPATLRRPASRRCARCGFVFDSVVTHTSGWSRAPIRPHAAFPVMRLSARAVHLARRRSARLPGASLRESVRTWRRCRVLSRRADAPPTSATDGDGSCALSLARPAKRPCSSAFAATSGGSRSAIVKVANAPSATTTIAATITISISHLPSVRAYARTRSTGQAARRSMPLAYNQRQMKTPRSSIPTTNIRAGRIDCAERASRRPRLDSDQGNNNSLWRPKCCFDTSGISSQ